MPRFFLDLDGVLADFEGHFLSSFGFPHNSVDDKTMWKHINSIPKYFFEMSIIEGAREFYDSIKVYNPIILTACPKSNYETSAIMKKFWFKKNFDNDALVLPVLGGKTKYLFIQNERDVLVDDTSINIVNWNAANGRGILHKNFEDTMTELDSIEW